MSVVLSQRVGMLTVQQLNHSQWHAIEPDGRWCCGVTDWADAVSAALWKARLTDLGVESIGLDGDRLVLVRPGIGA